MELVCLDLEKWVKGQEKYPHVIARGCLDRKV